MNQHVVNSTCKACPPGMTNAKKDDASRGNTNCTAAICKQDERVNSNACEPCPAGMTADAGGEASKGNTECTGYDVVLPLLNFSVHITDRTVLESDTFLKMVQDSLMESFENSILTFDASAQLNVTVVKVSTSHVVRGRQLQELLQYDVQCIVTAHTRSSLFKESLDQISAKALKYPPEEFERTLKQKISGEGWVPQILAMTEPTKTAVTTQAPPVVVIAGSCQLNAAFGTHSTCEVSDGFDLPDTSQKDAAYEFTALTTINISLDPLPFAESVQDEQTVEAGTETQSQPEGGHSVEFVVKGVNASMLRYNKVLEIGGDDTGYVWSRIYLVNGSCAEIHTHSQKTRAWRHYVLVTNWSDGNVTLNLYVDGNHSATKNVPGIPKCSSHGNDMLDECTKRGTVGPTKPVSESVKLRKFRVFAHPLMEKDVTKLYYDVGWVVPIEQTTEVNGFNCSSVTDEVLQLVIFRSLQRTNGSIRTQQFTEIQKEDISITNKDCTSSPTRRLMAQASHEMKGMKLVVYYTITVQQSTMNEVNNVLNNTAYDEQLKKQMSEEFDAGDISVNSSKPLVKTEGRRFEAHDSGGECNVWKLCTSMNPCTCKERRNCHNEQFCGVNESTQARTLITLTDGNRLDHRMRQSANAVKYCVSKSEIRSIFRCAEKDSCNEFGDSTVSTSRPIGLCIAPTSRMRNGQVANDSSNVCLGERRAIQCDPGKRCSEQAVSECHENVKTITWILPVCSIGGVVLIVVCIFYALIPRKTKHFPQYLQDALERGNLQDFMLDPDVAARADAALDLRSHDGSDVRIPSRKSIASPRLTPSPNPAEMAYEPEGEPLVEDCNIELHSIPNRRNMTIIRW